LAFALLAAALAVCGCGSSHHASTRSSGIPSSLLAQARPIGRGPRFHPPVGGPVLGACDRRVNRRSGVHVEVFAANRVVLLAAGIGTRPPRTFWDGRIAHADCYGALVTLDPTGLVLVRPGLRLRLSDLFRAWGQPLSQRRLASFTASGAGRVRVFVDGRRWPGAAATVPLRRHSEIVLEVGPYVPPHASYRFPPGT